MLMTEAAALAVREAEMATLANMDTALTVHQIIDQVRLIQDVMAGVMREGEHYGTIPGAKKPGLYKSGAEKLFMTFRITNRHEVEDLSEPGMIRYRVRTIAESQAGAFLGEGIGECSSAEEKYAWRAIKATGEWEATPESDRRIKWSMDGKKEIQAKQVRTSPFDFANTVLKMAKKRADVDACLAVTAASDIFAQDLEDLPGGPGPVVDAGAPVAAQAPVAEPARSASPPSTSNPVAAPAADILPPAIAHDILYALQELGTDEDAFVRQVLVPRGVHSIAELSEAQAAQLLSVLKHKVQSQTATA